MELRSLEDRYLFNIESKEIKSMINIKLEGKVCFKQNWAEEKKTIIYLLEFEMRSKKATLLKTL